MENDANCLYNFYNIPIHTHELFQPLVFSQKPRAASRGSSYYNKVPSAVPKIKEALNFMRNHSFEVPFIANYRKEYVEPELDLEDLWKIWQSDEKVRTQWGGTRSYNVHTYNYTSDCISD